MGRASGGGQGTSMGRSQRRGPKGWERSDERIKEDLCERIADSDELDASDVVVEVRQGVVTLDGTVVERWMRYSLTGFSRSEDIERSLQSGIDEHWVKPMNAVAFSHALGTARASHARPR